MSTTIVTSMNDHAEANDEMINALQAKLDDAMAELRRRKTIMESNAEEVRNVTAELRKHKDAVANTVSSLEVSEQYQYMKRASTLSAT